MTIIELLAHLRSLDIRIWAEGDQLCYDAPPGALSSSLRSELVARKAEMLVFLNQAHAATNASRPPLRPRTPTVDQGPLSFAQQRLWLLDQLSPGNPMYNIAAGVWLSGPLDVDILEKSLSQVVRRHEAMRTTFVVLDEQPVQVIGPPWNVSLAIENLAGVPEPDREAMVQRLANEESRRPFNLAAGPLFRGRLLRLAEQEHVLLFAMHHIVSDGWSMRILVREVITLYRAFRTNSRSPLPQLPVQYADVAIWQREWLQGPPLERLFSYWKQHLSDAPPVLQLPYDRPRPAVQTYRGSNHYFELDPTLTTALESLSQRYEATLFMTLLAAFQVLLARYSGQHTLLVGVPIANRTLAEIEGLIGCFINTLVIRTDLERTSSFQEVLAQVQEYTLNAYAHQELPFEQLVEQLQPERAVTHSPLFQVLFDLQDAPLALVHDSALQLRLLEVDTGTAKFDLSLAMTRTAAGLRGVMRYNTDLFEPATIVRMTRHFMALLGQVAAVPSQRITEIALLSAAEREQLLVDWNATQAIYPHEVCFHQLVADQAARTPQALAVTFENQSITYSDLDRRANQLAQYLQKRGVGPDVLVALCVEPAIDLLVGLLGILKAGGAYVPIDPEYPQERVAFILSDTRAAVLVTQQPLLARLPAHTAQVVCLDADAALAEEPADSPASHVTPAHLAYVLYTSGSTGRPKGVMIEHRSLVNYLYWVNSTMIGDSTRTIPAITRLTFDASLKQLLAPLLRGQTVWMLGADVVTQPARLLQQLSMYPDVVLNCVPSLWRAMLDALLAGLVVFPDESTFTLLLGGDQLSSELVALSFEALPQLRLWNVYGPTETTANASVAPLASDDGISIGKPIANTQMYVLDEYLQPLPIGVPGELYVGGVGLSRGYLNRPDLTAERFIPNPFATEDGGWRMEDGDLPSSILHPPSSRLYRTGDRARYRADGNIELLGRIDRQIKLRGFRVECGEIEIVLEQHPLVRTAVIALHEPSAGDQRLVAYIVPKIEDGGWKIEDRQPYLSEMPSSILYPPSSILQELRAFLKTRLPEYMVPAAYMFLESLPLMHNGKIDHRALPAPDWNAAALPAQRVAPRTPTERTLADIWSDLLGITGIGIHDNFFELGGHSLLATQAIARTRSIFQIDPSLQDFFEQPTIANLAAAIDAKRQQAAAQPGLKIQKIERRNPKTQRLISQIDQMSDIEVRQLLRDKKQSTSGETPHE